MDYPRGVHRPVGRIPVRSRCFCREFLYLYRLQATEISRGFVPCLGSYPPLFPNYPVHRFVLPSVQGIRSCRKHLQGNPSGSSRPDCSPYFQHGQISENQQVQCMDSCCFCPAHLADGSITGLHHRHRRHRRIHLWKNKSEIINQKSQLCCF